MGKLNGRKIEAMHLRYGVGPQDAKCGDCDNCVYHRYDKRYYKCRLYGTSSSESTDWRVRWPACGMFNKEPEPGVVPVIELLKQAKRPKPVENVEGQIKMEGIE